MTPTITRPTGKMDKDKVDNVDKVDEVDKVDKDKMLTSRIRVVAESWCKK